MRNRKMMIMWGMALCMAVALVPLVASASTEAQKDAAIIAGLTWLASTQNANGSWNEQNGYPQAATGSALLALQEHGFMAGDDVYGFGDVVGKGLDYLMNSAASWNLTKARSIANDHNANQLGAYWGGGEAIYTSGLVVTALSTAGAAQETRLATAGPFAGKTLKSIVGDAVDYFDQAQSTNAQYRGGWRYDVGTGNTADNSTSQWPAIAMLFAQGNMGVTVNQNIKDELKYWIAYIQNANGGAGYDNPGSIVDESKTGGLLVEMAWVGSDLNNVAYTAAHPKVAAAISYLNTTFLNGAGSHQAPWGGDFGHPYAMWSVYKGLETMIGLDVTSGQFITNLHADPGDVDNPNHGWNWWEDYCNYLVTTQNGNGSWNGYSYWAGAMAAGWYLNILQATHIPPTIIPEPLTCGALMLGLGGLFGYIRRRRLAA